MLSISIRFPIIFSLSLIGDSFGQSHLLSKGYSGYRLNPNTNLLLYYHDQTAAIVEFYPQNELANCELIDLSGKKNLQIVTLNNLRRTISREPKEIGFKMMMDLMYSCSCLPDPKFDWRGRYRESSVLVIPGTNWCGLGDVAINYYDLGSESAIDKCCRAHDFCPKKIQSGCKNYGVTNNIPLVTVSHCQCDSRFRNCLQNTRYTMADFMGAVFFNIIHPSCLAGEGNILKAVVNRYYF